MNCWVFLLYFSAIFYFHPNFCMFGFARELCLPYPLNNSSDSEECNKKGKEIKEQGYIPSEHEKKEISPRKRHYNENTKK